MIYKNTLISGASGDIGIGVGRILKSEGFPVVYGCDVNTDSWGVCVFGSIRYLPSADSPEYINALATLIDELGIELFIPTSEAELLRLSSISSSLISQVGCDVLMVCDDIIELSLDKLKTVEFLNKNNIKAPWTLESEGAIPVSYPFISKPRRGRGSRDVEIVTSEQRAFELNKNSGHVFQEYLLPESQEYTCGVFRSKSGEIRSININRTLQGGFTDKGTVVENRDIDRYIEQIVQSMNLEGAINLQLRLTESGPVLFEINPRFSSTVVFRHKLGFQDLIWSIQDLYDEYQRGGYEKPAVGTTFYRGLAEYFV